MDIIILVCHVILQDHAIIWSCDFMGRVKVSHYPATFCDHKHCGSGDTIFLVCHVIS